MKKVISLSVILLIVSIFAQDADAHGWRGRGYYRPRAYYAPAPCYHPYYAPAYRDVWVRPHWRRTPYGDEWIPGHWVRQRVC